MKNKIILTVKKWIASRTELEQRTISTIVIIATSPCLIIGKLPLWILIFVLAILGIREFIAAVNKIDCHPSKSTCYAMTVTLFSTYFLIHVIPKIYVDKIVLVWIFVGLIISLTYGWWRYCKSGQMQFCNSYATIVALLYIPLSMYAIILIDISQHILTYVVIIAAFGSDLFAFITGKSLNNLNKKTHKLTPKLSPNKTIEGAIGGLIGCTLISLIFSLIFAKEMWIAYVVMSFIGGIAAECGDLVASAIKRQVGIKDYGTILPGMGGILDRFDSVLLVAPTIYFLAPILL